MAGPRPSRPKKDRGAALVMVLWGAVVMSIIAAAAARQATTSAVVVNANAELTRAKSLADAGVRVGWSAFADGRIDDFNATWACRVEPDTLYVRLRPETARIDINIASEDLFEALFVAAGVDRSAATALAEQALKYRGSGTVSDENAQLEVPEDEPEQVAAGRFRKGPFQTIEEMGYLPGMGASLYRRIADDISVHSRSSDIDRRFASPIVRRALDEVGRDEGLMVGASAGASPVSDEASTPAEAVSPEGSLINVKAVAVTASGTVYVRDAVIEGPFTTDGAPTILRLVQGRLQQDEVLPGAPANTPSCVQGLVAIRKPS